MSPAGASLQASDRGWELEPSETRRGTVSLLRPEVLHGAKEQWRELQERSWCERSFPRADRSWAGPV